MCARHAAAVAPANPEVTVAALLLVPAAAADMLSPSTTAEIATKPSLILVICLLTGGVGPEPSPGIDVERICLPQYIRVDIHVKHQDALPLLEYVGHLW